MVFCCSRNTKISYMLLSNTRTEKSVREHVFMKKRPVICHEHLNATNLILYNCQWSNYRAQTYRFTIIYLKFDSLLRVLPANHLFQNINKLRHVWWNSPFSCKCTTVHNVYMIHYSWSRLPDITPAFDVLLQNMDSTTGGKHGSVAVNPFNITQFKSTPVVIIPRPKQTNTP